MATESVPQPDDADVIVRPIAGATTPLPPRTDDELAAMRAAHPDQAWFWTREWYDGEREVDERWAAGGRGTIFYSTEEFFAFLDSRPAADDPNDADSH